MNAKDMLKKNYSTSACLDIVLNLIVNFENLNQNTKYKNDLMSYIHESKMEDLYKKEDDCIYVSTIHKSKGKEYDSIYLLYIVQEKMTDADLRAIYVGLTRAKKNLFIHTNSHIFDDCIRNGIEYINDNRRYPTCKEIIVSLSHRDVFLGFFKDRNKIIFKIRSGDILQSEGIVLYTTISGRREAVCKFSKSFYDFLSKYYANGYKIKKAVVRFVVAWQAEDDDKPSAVLLPTIYLEKNS